MNAMTRVKMAKSDPPLIGGRPSELESLTGTDVYHRFLPHQSNSTPFLEIVRPDERIVTESNESTFTQRRGQLSDLFTSFNTEKETIPRNFETHVPSTEEMSYKDNP